MYKINISLKSNYIQKNDGYFDDAEEVEICKIILDNK